MSAPSLVERIEVMEDEIKGLESAIDAQERKFRAALAELENRLKGQTKPHAQMEKTK